MSPCNLDNFVRISTVENGIRIFWFCGDLDEYIALHRIGGFYPLLYDILNSEEPIGVKIRGINYTRKNDSEELSFARSKIWEYSRTFVKFGASVGFICPLCKKTIFLSKQEATNCCVKEKIVIALQTNESYVSGDIAEQMRAPLFSPERLAMLKAICGMPAKEISQYDFLSLEKDNEN